MSANTLLTSIVTGGSNSHATVAEEANAYATDFVTQGVVGTFGLNSGSGGTGAYCVNADASPDMGITLKAGQAYVTATPSGQNSQVLRVRAAADYTAYTINANASGSTKYDWIYLSISATNANTPSSDASNVASFVTSRSSSNSTDNGSPPTYGLLLAVVTVANGASSITNANIQDRRVQASVSTAGTSNTTGWITGLATPNTVAYNGNRSYTLTVNGTDLTGTVSAGMRLRTTRLVAAPTQCTSLNGTTQYYSKSSPAGMTFTDKFVAMAWVKLTSYVDVGVISRYNGTSGWILEVLSTGQVRLSGFNAGSSNVSHVDSYQSIPLNKWVHVAAQLDMVDFTATTTTSYVMIDGINAPASVTRGGTNPTSLVQAGSLEIGSYNGGTSPFAGKIAQAAVFSAQVTQATIQGYVSQGLAGTETSLISAYSFNNSINDLNANANNLTANGSAVATNADSPFGGQAGGSVSSTLDYGIITSASFSTNTTLVVQVPEGCTIPTSGGVSAVSYSSVKVPYGFPGQEGKWTVESIYKNTATQASPVNGTWYNLGSTQLSIPIGEWATDYAVQLYIAKGSAAGTRFSTLSTANNSESDPEFSAGAFENASGDNSSMFVRSKQVSLSSATIYYLNAMYNTTGGTSFQFFVGVPFKVRVKCAHL